MNVLFLCTGNSCRSILAEVTFNHLAPAGWSAISAGSHPTGFVHPYALRLLTQEGIATDGCHSKSWNDLPLKPDMAITVCGDAAAEEGCPAYLGAVLRAHWGVDDPARVIGSEAEVITAFKNAYQLLRLRIEAFFALPLNELQIDRQRFKYELERIGQIF